MRGRKQRKLFLTETKHTRRRKYLVLLIFIVLSFSLLLLVWADLTTEKEVSTLPFEWLWYTNASVIVEQISDESITHGSMVSVPVDGLVENLMEVTSGLSVNPHKFKYLHNPGPMTCSSSREDRPIFLVYIHSAPQHYSRRLLIRETWGNQYNFDDVDIRTIFMCGATNNSIAQAALDLEFDRYGDIVQEDFVDSYRNLTHKAVMALQWISNHCLNARIVIKADDDIFINIFKLVPHLNGLMKQKELLREPLDRMIVCNVWSQMKVIRDPNSKWYISKTEFSDEYFKTYCSGSAYAFTPGMARSMFEVSRNVPFFWVDDYYVTGMLPAKLQDVSYESINKFYFLSTAEFLEKFSSVDSKLVVGQSHSLNNWKHVWKSITGNRTTNFFRRKIHFFSRSSNSSPFNKRLMKRHDGNTQMR